MVRVHARDSGISWLLESPSLAHYLSAMNNALETVAEEVPKVRGFRGGYRAA